MPAAGGALVARTGVPAAARASRVAPGAVAPLRTLRRRAEVAAAAGAAAALAVPEALVQPASRLDVPAGWHGARVTGRRHRDHADRAGARVVRARRRERRPTNRRTVVHLEQGRLLASLEGGAGRRLEIVSPGAVTDVVGTLFSVEVVGGASRVAVAHGRVQVSAAPDSSGAPPRAPREIAAGQSWLTTLPEPDELEPALAEALADHERTPPPRGATVPLSVTEAPAGAGVWVGKRRIASAPAWVLVEPHAAVRLSAPARAAARRRILSPPRRRTVVEPSPAVDRAVPRRCQSRRRARRGRPGRARCSHHQAPQPTEPPPLDPAPRRPRR